MTTSDFCRALLEAANVTAVEVAIASFEAEHAGRFEWVPVGGRPNNRGVIEVSGDPGRSLVERITNGVDGILDREHEAHRGYPDCRTPKEAATAWLNVPDTGLSGLTQGQRRSIAQRMTIRLEEGDGRNGRIVDVIDEGIGMTPDEMPRTILSLNESNKIEKYYLVGTYGQGGSSTFASSRYTMIASRSGESTSVGFTVVKYLDLPPERFKTGHYVYLTLDHNVLQSDELADDFRVGTRCRHFGYDLSQYPSPLGPNSVYGLLQYVLFDPVLPVWLDSHQVHGYRRVIKGSRNALNGAVDEGDEDARGPSLSHNVNMFFVQLGEFGRLGIEYWVLTAPEKTKKVPIAAFVNPKRPIILTLNGQNQAEMSQTIVRRHAELPYLVQRVICHLDCNTLTRSALRSLFVSTREDARRSAVFKLIEQEIIRVLQSDDELKRLNTEAKESLRREQDETAVEQMRREVARLLHLQGFPVSDATGSQPNSSGEERPSSSRSGGTRRRPDPIEPNDPPTFIRFVWEEDEPIRFFPEQRRYLRIETDAPSQYHNPSDPSRSSINVIVTGEHVSCSGSTPLQGGRMRLVIDCSREANIGGTGSLRVEMIRRGLPTLSDQRSIEVVEPPHAATGPQPLSMPPFRVEEVQGPDDDMWTMLGWPDNANLVASSAEIDEGTLLVYYSAVFPRFAAQVRQFERRDPSIATSFVERYKIWLAVHSLILYQDQQMRAADEQQAQGSESEPEEERERQERCRTAMLAVLFASREALEGPKPVGNDD